MIYQLDLKKLRDILKKAVAINSKPTEESFPELPQILIWMRFVLGASYGIYVGLQGLKGGALALQVLNLVAFLPYIYCRMYLGVSESGEAGSFGTATIIFSGTAQGVALALLIWIYFYTAQMEDQESKLAALLIAPMAEMLGGDSLDGGDSSAGSNSMAEETLTVPVVDQDEF